MLSQPETESTVSWYMPEAVKVWFPGDKKGTQAETVLVLPVKLEVISEAPDTQFELAPVNANPLRVPGFPFPELSSNVVTPALEPLAVPWLNARL